MCSALYKDTLKQYVENKYVVESTGWKPLAETINGRAAMLVSIRECFTTEFPTSWKSCMCGMSLIMQELHV